MRQAEHSDRQLFVAEQFPANKIPPNPRWRTSISSIDRGRRRAAHEAGGVGMGRSPCVEFLWVYLACKVPQVDIALGKSIPTGANDSS